MTTTLLEIPHDMDIKLVMGFATDVTSTEEDSDSDSDTSVIQVL